MAVYVELGIEVTVLLIMGMLIDEVGAELHYLFAGYALSIQGVIGDAFYLTFVLLEALQFLVGRSGIDDAALSREMVCEKLPLNEGKSFLFPIVILVVIIEAGFDDPFQPCAVGFLVKGVHGKRCHSTHKVLHTFLLLLGNKSGALITGCLVVPKVGVDHDIGLDLDVHLPVTDTEAEIGRWSIGFAPLDGFEISGNFHLLQWVL